MLFGHRTAPNDTAGVLLPLLLVLTKLLKAGSRQGSAVTGCGFRGSSPLVLPAFGASMGAGGAGISTQAGRTWAAPWGWLLREFLLRLRPAAGLASRKLPCTAHPSLVDVSLSDLTHLLSSKQQPDSSHRSRLCIAPGLRTVLLPALLSPAPALLHPAGSGKVPWWDCHLRDLRKRSQTPFPPSPLSPDLFCFLSLL